MEGGSSAPREGHDGEKLVPRVELNDLTDVDTLLAVLGAGEVLDRDLHGSLINREPRRSRVLFMCTQNLSEHRRILGLSAYDNHLSWLYAEGWDGDADTIDSEEAVTNELTCLHASHGEACAEDGVIQATLKQLLECITCLASHLCRLAVESLELLFRKTVHVASLLLFQKLLAVLRELSCLALWTFTRAVWLACKDLVVLVRAKQVYTLAADFLCFRTGITHRRRR